MSFKLKKAVQVVAAVGGVVAAPFTGGASLAITAGAVGSMSADSAANQQKKLQNASIDAAQKLEAQQVQDALLIQQNATALSPTVTPTTVAQNTDNSGSYGTIIQSAAKPDYTPIYIGGGVAAAAVVFALLMKRK